MRGWMQPRRSTGRSGDQTRADAGDARETDGDAVAYSIAVIGTSWGGLAALRSIIERLPERLCLPLAIVQPRPPASDTLLARFLQGRTGLSVCEVEDKQAIEPGRVFVAPANYHLLVEQGHFSLSIEAPVRSEERRVGKEC